MKHVKVCIIAVVHLLLPFILFAMPVIAEENILRLSVDDCIEYALTKNLSLKSSRLGIRLNELSVIQEESAFDPGLSVNLSRGKSEQPNYTSYIPVSAIESKTTRLNFTYGQNLTTGANWGVGIYNTLSESNIELEKNYTSYLGFSVNQPLLKGFGKNINRSGIFVAGLTGETTKLDVENNAVELLFQVLTAYWNLVNALESQHVYQLAFAQADSLLAYNQKGLELGVKTESDVLEAKSARLACEQDILNQKNAIREAGDVLKKLLNISSDGDWSQQIVPTEKLAMKPIVIDDVIALQEALEQRPEYQRILTSLKQDDILLEVAENFTLPDLNLNASYRLNSSGTSVGKNIENLGEIEAFGWEIGLRLDYPLKNRNSKSALQKRKIEIKRNKLMLDDLKNQIISEIRTSIGRVNINSEKVDVAAMSVEVNELKLRMEEERFRNHLSTSYLVLQFQKDLANARNLYNLSLKDYTMAVLEYRRSKGTLLKDLNVNIVTR